MKWVWLSGNVSCRHISNKYTRRHLSDILLLNGLSAVNNKNYTVHRQLSVKNVKNLITLFLIYSCWMRTSPTFDSQKIRTSSIFSCVLILVTADGFVLRQFLNSASQYTILITNQLRYCLWAVKKAIRRFCMAKLSRDVTRLPTQSNTYLLVSKLFNCNFTINWHLI